MIIVRIISVLIKNLFFKIKREQSRTISELQNELEFERIKREKLEVQLDHSRQELEKSLKMLKDYETKVYKI